MRSVWFLPAPHYFWVATAAFAQQPSCEMQSAAEKLAGAAQKAL